MHDARMLWLALLDPIEDRGSLELARIRLVSEVARLKKRQRIEHGGLSVVRVLLVQPRHCGRILRRPRFLVYPIVILEERAQRFYPVALTLGRRCGDPCFPNGLPPPLQELQRKRRRKRIGTLADRNAPVRHRARGFSLGNGLECLLGFRVEK